MFWTLILHLITGHEQIQLLSRSNCAKSLQHIERLQDLIFTASGVVPCGGLSADIFSGPLRALSSYSVICK